MGRYDGVQTKKTKEKLTAMKPVIYPDIPKTSEDLYVMTVVGDRLEYLAHQYYGDVSLWWIIAQANGLGHGSTAVEPGVKLRIPNKPADIVEQQRLDNRT